MIILQYLVNFGVQMKKIKCNKVASDLHLLVLFFREISADVKKNIVMGVVFLICVPTANYERVLLNGFHGIHSLFRFI